MSDLQYRRKRQMKEARLNITGELYKKGYSIRKIREEVMARLQLEKLSVSTVKLDIDLLLKEWRESRVEDMDLAIQLELERIDDCIRELWAAWEKSKTDSTATFSKQKGVAATGAKSVAVGGEIVDGKPKIVTTNVEKTEKTEINNGDPRYLAEIRQQLQERRKLLGMYAPDKKELSGELGFLSLLMESGVVEDSQNDA